MQCTGYSSGSQTVDQELPRELQALPSLHQPTREYHLARKRVNPARQQAKEEIKYSVVLILYSGRVQATLEV